MTYRFHISSDLAATPDVIWRGHPGPGHRFREESTMLTQARWEHERELHAVDGGCRIVDSLAWRGRIGPLGALYQLAVPVLFRHRHRRLRRRFGVPPRATRAT